MAHTLTFLGTGASCGVPVYYCGCEACKEALEHPEYARTCSSLAIRGAQTTLIDASPELRIQFARTGITNVDQVLFTHEHFDHVGGLPQLEYYVRLITKRALPVFASDQAANYIQSHFDFMMDTLDVQTIVPFELLEFDGIKYRPLPATHNPGALGYLIYGPHMRVGYFCDCGPLTDASFEALKSADVLIFDATFNGKNWMESEHHTIDGVIKLARELRPKRTYLTHLSMHFDTPITASELEEKLARIMDEEGLDIRLPKDGESFEL